MLRPQDLPAANPRLLERKQSIAHIQQLNIVKRMKIILFKFNGNDSIPMKSNQGSSDVKGGSSSGEVNFVLAHSSEFIYF